MNINRNMNKQKQTVASLSVNVTRRNFIVAGVSLDGTSMSISSEPVWHETVAQANAERNRLAQNMPGRMFITLQAVGTARVNGMEIL